MLPRVLSPGCRVVTTLPHREEYLDYAGWSICPRQGWKVVFQMSAH